MSIRNAVRRRAKRARAERDVGNWMIHTKVVEAHCETLFPGETWSHEQILFVDALVRDWDADHYDAVARGVADDPRRRGVHFEGLDDDT
jgi:hypothetical protein